MGIPVMERPNPYYDPEKMNLRIIAALEYATGYEFDTRVVWQHIETGKFYTARDSGCSCPTPFEEYTDLDKLARCEYDHLVTEIQYELGKPDHEVKESEAMEFLEKLRAAQVT